MADAQDLKSWGLKKPCRFESDHRHHLEGVRSEGVRAVRSYRKPARVRLIMALPWDDRKTVLRRWKGGRAREAGYFWRSVKKTEVGVSFPGHCLTRLLREPTSRLFPLLENCSAGEGA